MPRTTFPPTRAASQPLTPQRPGAVADVKTPDCDSDADVLVVLKELVKRLTARAADGAHPPADHSGRRVLYEVRVERVQCLFVELPAYDHRGNHVSLSPREQEIARMVAQGYANKTIAAVLEISTWTVGTYLRRIFAKLGVGTRAAMVARQKELGADTALR